MSILNEFKEEYTDKQHSTYTPPAVLSDDEGFWNFKRSVIFSTILHPSVVVIALLVTFILTLLGINLKLFNPPTEKQKDIEFVLVDHEDTPVNKHTKNRSDMNSRSGGINNPKKPLSMPSPPPGKVQNQATASSNLKSNKPAQQPKTQQKAKPTPQVAKPTVAKSPVQAKPQPPTARPSIRPPMTPKTVAKPSSAFSIPVPSGGTKSGTYSTGPISGTGKSATGGSGSYAPTPSLAPTGSGSGSGTRLSRGSGGGGTGNVGNPGGGGGRPGIDAIREPDFGPYMRDLQKRIKTNWDPPKGNESKRVVLLFKIAKDGRLLSCSVFKSSGLPNADRAALNAVQLTAPFRPLPADYKGQSIDIQFTFDYNVFQAATYR